MVSFAVTTENAKHIVSPEFKKAGHAVVLFDVRRGEDAVLDWDVFRQHCDFIHEHMVSGDIYSARAVGKGGLAATLAEMAFGNGIGFTVSSDVSSEDLFALRYGAIVVETDAEKGAQWARQLNAVAVVAQTIEEPVAVAGDVRISLSELQTAWEKTLSRIFPLQSQSADGSAELPLYTTYGPKRRP